MKTLREFLTHLTQADREAFAIDCLTTWPHLRNCMYGLRKPSAALAAQIEIASRGVVPRNMTRPVDAHVIWPADFSLVDGRVVRVDTDASLRASSSQPADAQEPATSTTEVRHAA